MAQRVGLKFRGPFLLLGALLLLVAADISVRGDEKHEKASTQVARRIWAATDLVMEKHLASPSRQEMLLAALRSMAAPGSNTADLSRRVSEVVTPEQLAALLRERWPMTKEGNPANEKTLSETLFQRMLQVVPGQPEFIPLNQYKVMEQLSHNRYVGTGIQIRWNVMEELAEILVPFPGGPARKAGARPGDLIVEVDGVSVANVNLNRVVELLRGEDGTAVTMTVRQAGTKEKRLLKITRGVVPLPMLVGHHRLGEEEWGYRPEKDTPIGYVRVTRLTSSVVHELRQIEQRLLADGCKALILDLRFTSGTELSHGVMAADSLLDGGLICRVRDREGKVKEYQADRDCLFRGWPMAVLTGPTTRGVGPETLAAALRDRKRATVIGEATFGDWYVTTPVALPDDLGYVRLGTGIVDVSRIPASDRRPLHPPESGRRGEAGVQPDQIIALNDPRRQVIQDWQFGQEKPNASGKEKVPDDPVLQGALDHLREKLRNAPRKQ